LEYLSAKLAAFGDGMESEEKMKNQNIVVLSASLNQFKMDELGDLCINNLEDTNKEIFSVPNISECFILEKCNCVEIYFITDKNEVKELIEKVKHVWIKSCKSSKSINNKLNRVEVIVGEKALRHILETSVGLKSVTLGDAQVYGQVKKAIRISKISKTFSDFLSNLETQIKKLSKEVDKNTNFRRGNTSVPRATIELINQYELFKSKILIVGLGKMGATIAQILSKKGIEFSITNRNIDKSISISEKYGCKYFSFEKLNKKMCDFDVIICATSKARLFNKNNVKKKSLFFIDLGNPPNVSSNIMGDHKVINISEIQKMNKEAIYKRQKAIMQVKTIVDKNVFELLGKIIFFEKYNLEAYC
jgi:glutamyl-tRNA reductase